MQPDFSLIYSELGLRPDCSLVEFKRAYLRRIGELHPDRNGGAAATSDAQAVLTDLIAAYVAVCRFHRRYGRMPGAGRGGPCSVAYSGGGGSAGGGTSSRGEHPLVTHSSSNAPSHSGPTRRLLLVFLALLALLASWDWLTL